MRPQKLRSVCRKEEEERECRKGASMSALESCCCCSLRAGTVFIGALGLMTSVGAGAACGLLIASQDLAQVIQTAYNTYYDLANPTKIYGANGTVSGPRDLELGDPELMYVEWAIIATLLCMFVSTVANLLLIVGAVRETQWMLVPWMVVHWLTILLTIGVFGLVLKFELVAMPRYWWAVMFMVGVVMLMMLSFVLVLSLYQVMRSRETPEFYQGAELVHRHIWLSPKGKYYD